MSSFTIQIANFDETFNSEISIPVIEDPDRPLPTSSDISNQFNIGTPFSFTFNEVIQTADRHLYIKASRRHSEYENPEYNSPVEYVSDWINLLRWEFNAFWEVNSQNNWYDDEFGTYFFSSEHSRRVGELIAEGIALLLVEKRLNIPRSKFFFLKGTDARPDYVMKPSCRLQRSLLLPDRRLVGIEARSRCGWNSIHQKDKDQLDEKKKAKFSQVIAVYSSYGKPSSETQSVRTKIILGDPMMKNSRKANDKLVEKILKTHYWGVFERIGIPSIQETISDGEQFDLKKIERLLTKETVGNKTYLGRYYSEMLVLRDKKMISEDYFQQRIAIGNYGQVFYKGINRDVLTALSSGKILALEDYFDEGVTKAKNPENGSKFIGGDGTITIEHKNVSPDSDFGKAIQNQAKLRPKP